jgi:hypothetical protein
MLPVPKEQFMSKYECGRPVFPEYRYNFNMETWYSEEQMNEGMEPPHPCDICARFHPKNMCLSEGKCIYPGCPNPETHDIATCPTIIKRCRRCGMIGHIEKSHEVANLFQLYSVWLLFIDFNPKTAVIRDSTTKIEVIRFGKNAVVTPPRRITEFVADPKERNPRPPEFVQINADEQGKDKEKASGSKLRQY